MKRKVSLYKTPGLFFILILLVVMISFPSSAAPKLKKTSLTLKKGNYYVLRLKGNSAGADVTWKTSAKKKVSIASKSHNRVVLQAKKTGKAVISAKIGGRTLKCRVTVKKNEAYPSSLTLRVGGKYTFSLTKKAKWSLSKFSKGFLSAESGKKVTFTAKKTGTVKVIAKRGKKTYNCTVKIIRKDGASKADLKEEKAIEEAKKNAQDQDDGTDTESRTDEQIKDSLTQTDKNMMATLAHSACSWQLETEEMRECNIHSMDLSAEARAFVLYEYIYKYVGEQDTEADLSVITSEYDEYRCISPEALEAFMIHLFGEEYHSDAMDIFINKYVSDYKDGAYYVECVGDFGDAGLSYFTTPDSITVQNGMVCAGGKVMSWNENMESYIHTHTYKAFWYQRSEKRKVALTGTDYWLQFDHVEVV